MSGISEWDRLMASLLHGGMVPERTYTISNGETPYITRTLFPRVGPMRPMLHQIHRADADEALHNHPWRTATSLILSGGYTEERLVGDEKVQFTYGPGDVNRLDAGTFHRISAIEPNTWTMLVVGERMQSWGFLVPGEGFVESSAYFARTGHADLGGNS